MDIEKIIINNFYEILKDNNSKSKPEDIQRYVLKMKSQLKYIKENNQLEVLTVVHILHRELHQEINQNNKKMLIKFSKVFKGVASGIFLSLSYKCSTKGGYSDSNDPIYTIIEISEEFEQKAINILDENCSNWKNFIKIKKLD